MVMSIEKCCKIVMMRTCYYLVDMFKDYKKHFRSSTTLFCFSPPVMLATFLIEVIGAVYTFLRYKVNHATRIIIAVLICLGVFQLAEYLICEVPMLPGLTWSRIGYVAITLLPPLGASLAMAIAAKRSLLAQIVLYFAAACFIGYFLFAEGALGVGVCAGNYVIFESINSQFLYGVYYYGLLATTVVCCLAWARSLKDEAARSALVWLAVGYLLFMLPTTTVNLMDRSTIGAIPSIMCGFAVLLAIVLIFAVLPKVARKR